MPAGAANPLPGPHRTAVTVAGAVVQARPGGATATPCTVESGNIISSPFGTNTPLTADQTVRFQTSDADLLAGLDYVAVDRIVTIPAGATSVEVPIQLLPHAFTQSGKHFNVIISSYSAGPVVSGTARVTVWN